MCLMWFLLYVVFFFKQKTAYEMRISDWSSDVCSSDLEECGVPNRCPAAAPSHHHTRAPGQEAGCCDTAGLCSGRQAGAADDQALRPCQVVEAPQPRTQFPAHAPSPADPRYPAQGGSRRGAVSGLCRCAVAGRPTLRPGNIVVLDDFSSHKRSEEHTSELQSLMRISYAVFCLKKKNTNT